MQFFTLAALFGAAAMATPAPQIPSPPAPGRSEKVDLTNYTLRKNNGTIQTVSFNLSGKNATDIQCSGGPYPTLPAPVETCGDSKYRFGLYKPDNGTVNSFGIRLYHELGTAFGLSGEGEVPTYCHAGGNGIQDFICQQTVPAYTVALAA